MLKYVVVLISLLMAMSCSSVESDAKKAASLISESIEYTHDLKFEKAEKSYLRARKIIDKYVEKNKTVEFYEYLAIYRDKE